jgi:hypothetical protein
MRDTRRGEKAVDPKRKAALDQLTQAKERQTLRSSSASSALPPVPRRPKAYDLTKEDGDDDPILPRKTSSEQNDKHNKDKKAEKAQTQDKKADKAKTKEAAAAASEDRRKKGVQVEEQEDGSAEEVDEQEDGSAEEAVQKSKEKKGKEKKKAVPAKKGASAKKKEEEELEEEEEDKTASDEDEGPEKTPSPAELRKMLGQKSSSANRLDREQSSKCIVCVQCFSCLCIVLSLSVCVCVCVFVCVCCDTFVCRAQGAAQDNEGQARSIATIQSTETVRGSQDSAASDGKHGRRRFDDAIDRSPLHAAPYRHT